MRNVRACIIICCFLTASLLFAQKEDWLPITPEDLQIKEVPGDPGASAIQLYYANFIDDSNSSEFIYRRIKILTEKGKQWADVEINVVPDTSIKDLKARTIRPDGSIVDFTGKPFEKTVLKGRGIKWLVKTFTLPEVSVGSLVEYKYKQVYGYRRTSDNWILQHDLFTVREEFKFKPYEGVLAGRDFFDEGSRLAWVGRHITKDQEPKMLKDNRAELQLQNVPGFDSEEYMPPKNNYKSSVRFFYLNPQIKSTDTYWEYVGKRICEFIDHFIGDHKETRQEAMEAIGNESDPEKKLRKLYTRAQQIRNLSYERERTEEEQKKEKLKSNEGVVDLLKRGYGDEDDITFAFVAMARAAGFDASVLLVSNREEAFFSKELLSARQLDRLIADVKVDGKDIYLDPGTKYCPYGLLRWMRTATTALKPDKKNPVLVEIPGATFQRAVTRRTVEATLDAGGSLKADLTVQFEGTEALERKLSALRTDDAGRKKQLEDDVKSWLPAEAVANFTEARGWESPNEPLIARFHVEIAGYASAAGKRLLLPSYMFQVRRKDAFARADRKYPVYFPYAFAEVDVIKMKVPAGYTIEGNPQNEDFKVAYAAYQNAGKFESNQLVVHRTLLFNVIFVPLKQYAEVKDFFSKVQAGDEQQAVLRVADTSPDKKEARGPGE